MRTGASNIESTELDPIVLEIIQTDEGSRFRRARWLPRDAALGVAIALLTAALGYYGNNRATAAALESIPKPILLVTGVIIQVGIFLSLPLWLMRRRSDPVNLAVAVKPSAVKEFFIAIPATFVVMVCVATSAAFAQWVLLLMHRKAETPQQFWGRFDPATLAVFAVLAIAVAPIIEEIFFRGFLYNSLRRVCPAWLAIFLQAILFGLGHLYEPLGLVITSVIGLLLAMIYEWRKTLMAPMFVHAIWNTFVTTIAAAIVIAGQNKPMIGIYFSPVSDGRVIVQSVIPGSPAEETDIQPGDVILAYDGTKATDGAEFTNYIRGRKAGDVVEVLLLRGEEPISKRVKLRTKRDVEKSLPK